MNFITSRLSKDNFWNLVVFLGILLTVAIAEHFSSALMFVLAFTAVPYLLTRFNKVKYLEDGTIVNSQGEDLNDRLPRALLLIIILDLILISYKFFGLIAKTPDGFKGTVALGIITFLPTLYFVIKNCPISILFNLTPFLCRRTIDASGISKDYMVISRRPMSSSHDHSASRNDLITNPIYGHLPQNIYHSNHNRRH
jgi:hypothetical protein